MADPFLSTTNGASPKQVSITFLSYIQLQVLMNALACTRGQVHNVILVPGYIKATQCKKNERNKKYKTFSLRKLVVYRI